MSYRVRGQQGRWTSDLYLNGRKVDTLPVVTRNPAEWRWPRYVGPVDTSNKNATHYRLLEQKMRIVLHERLMSENGEPLPRRGRGVGVFRIANLIWNDGRIEFDIVARDPTIQL